MNLILHTYIKYNLWVNESDVKNCVWIKKEKEMKLFLFQVRHTVFFPGSLPWSSAFSLLRSTLMIRIQEHIGMGTSNYKIKITF